MIAVETTAANCHDSKSLLTLLDKAGIKPGIRVHADKAYAARSITMPCFAGMAE